MTRHRLAGRLTLLILLGGLLLAAWESLGSSRARPNGTTGPCACELERLRNGWCATCAKGFVAGCEIRSKVLHDALDAHGHELDPAVMTCAACKRLHRDGGFCEACRFGWIDGKAYMSRLTYHLAKGRPRERASLPCAVCARYSGGVDWCDTCQGGWAGNVFFERREDHTPAVREFERLQLAIEASQRCETCSLVILVDGECRACGLTYRDGKPASGAER